jgi:3-deoxy-manno-octulosonate cytidylyltransferase (CMP-KDO synthetase)
MQIQGRSMIEHVYRRASEANGIVSVVVATDDDRIKNEVIGFGGQAVMTSSDHNSGTDRVAEVAAGLKTDIVVNAQGDEPLIEPRAIEQAIEPMLENSEIKMATLMTKLDDRELPDPHTVKVVVDRTSFALYFSRAPIPYSSQHKAGPVHKHIGLYAYRRDFLLKLARMEATPLEKAESLEQLRVIEHGYRIKCIYTQYQSIGVNTPQQLEQVSKILEKSSCAQ